MMDPSFVRNVLPFLPRLSQDPSLSELYLLICGV